MARQLAGRLQHGITTSSAPYKGFESALENKFPKGCTIFLCGPVGAGKTIFCENLAKAFLADRAGCVYVSTERVPADIREDLRILGTDIDQLETKKRLTFVDGYSWLAGGSPEPYRVENLANLSELTITIEKACTNLGQDQLIILDSISPLCLHNPEEDVTRFVQLLAARIKGWGANGIFVVQTGVHSQEFYNVLAYLVDGTFDLRQDMEVNVVKRYFRVRNLRFSSHDIGWMPFTIEPDKGFKLDKESKIPK